MAVYNFLPVVSSTLSTDALIEQVLSHYRLSTPFVCHFFKHGINDTYWVVAGDTQYILRVYVTGEHTAAQVEAEIAVLEMMKEQNITASHPIPKRDGRYITTIQAPEGIRYVVLFSFVDGQVVHNVTPEQIRVAGEALARFHQLFDDAGRSFDRPRHDATSLIDEPVATMEAFTPLANQTQNITYLVEVAGQLKLEITPLPTTAPAYGLCHGDFMTGNLLWQGSNLAILDLDFCAYCWRVYDLATYVWLQVHTTTRPRTEALNKLDALVGGYQSIRSLSSAELRALPYFVLVRHIWLLGGSGIPRSTRHGIGWLSGDFFENYSGFIRAWLG